MKETTPHPIMSFKEAFELMSKVAKGEQPAPSWAGKKVYATKKAEEEWESFSTSANEFSNLTRLCKENIDLIAAIKDQQPASIAELARLLHRKEPNVSRTMAKLAEMGIVELIESHTGRNKKPILKKERISFDFNLLTGQVEVKSPKVGA